jgi:soluble lytic murein transglycosylase
MKLLRSTTLCVSMLAVTAAFAADPGADRSTLRQALEQAEKGPLSAWPAIERQYRGHALKPWLDYAALRRRLDSAKVEEVDEFLTQNADMVFAPALRKAWLQTRIKQRDWQGFRALHRGEDDPEMRCAALLAQFDQGVDDDSLDAAVQVWMSAESLPSLCDAPFEALSKSGRITDTLRTQRIELALRAGNASLARFLARPLQDSERLRIEAYSDFLTVPDAKASAWGSEAIAQQVVRDGLLRLARRDPTQAETLLDRLADPVGLTPAGRDAVRYAIALWSSANYAPEAAARLARVPDASYDDRLHEWRAREAMARSDWKTARMAILAMPDALGQQTRWRYFRARTEELMGLQSEARQLLAEVASESNYHGFLAADRLGWPYALCPLQLDSDATRRSRVGDVPGLKRALLLHRIGRHPWARMEWARVSPTLSAEERREAVRLAGEIGWHDRAVFSLTSGEDLQHYALRFPLSYGRTLRAEGKQYSLDPAWMAALIRAESAWMPDARSATDARGLMQLLPGTAAEVARKRGLPWAGGDSLYRPITNLKLGSAYLAAMRDRFDGHVALATAAYNAGPSPVLRWRNQRPLDPIDVWIETIPYFETREYVARILAFSVIYDWRLQGEARSLSSRLGQEASAARTFNCPI